MRQREKESGKREKETEREREREREIETEREREIELIRLIIRIRERVTESDRLTNSKLSYSLVMSLKPIRLCHMLYSTIAKRKKQF